LGQRRGGARGRAVGLGDCARGGPDLEAAQRRGLAAGLGRLRHRVQGHAQQRAGRGGEDAHAHARDGGLGAGPALLPPRGRHPQGLPRRQRGAVRRRLPAQRHGHARHRVLRGRQPRQQHRRRPRDVVPPGPPGGAGRGQGPGLFAQPPHRALRPQEPQHSAHARRHGQDLRRRHGQGAAPRLRHGRRGNPGLGGS
ncbi:hypothetical protein H632_c5306p0, partial [Helicosporidium sp. ATCC 50920]